MMMTVKQLRIVCETNKYILLRFKSGHVMGVNCGVSKIAWKRGTYHDHDNTVYVSYRSVGLMEYITHKHKFIST